MSMSSKKGMAGFSLTELLVAVTIGLIILAGVSSVMVSSKKTYTAQDSLARLQENARTAMLIMTRDIRNIGYWGCNPDKQNVNSALKSATSISSVFYQQYDMEGSENGSSYYPSGEAISLVPAPRAGTDILRIRGLDTSTSFNVTQPMVSESAVLKVAPNHGINEGEVLVVSDCSSADIFQVTNANQANGSLVHNTGGSYSPGNKLLGGGNKLSKSYGSDAVVMRYIANTYYIAPGASGEPSLWRQSLVTASSSSQPQSTELVEGIENLQILYGVDSDNDNLPDSFKYASQVSAASWNDVVAMRFGIIARALSNLQTTKSKTANKSTQLDNRALDIDGDGTDDFTGSEGTSTTQTGGGPTALDAQYDRRMFRTTVLLRNMRIRN